MKLLKNPLFDALWYLIVFLLIQVFASLTGSIAWFIANGQDLQAAVSSLNSGVLSSQPMGLIVVSALTSLLVIIVFASLRWSPFSRQYIRTRPWSALVWVALLACGTIIPSAWMLEVADFKMDKGIEDVLTHILSRPEGYFVVGILAPLGEEMVFRGAILRSLLNIFDKQWAWVAIVISALSFGLVHGNLAQGFHATLIGLLLGWMYWRTDSIVPGIVFHWINNTIAFVMANLLPNSQDAKLAELFGGNERMVWYALAFSMCIFLPSLYQLTLRLKKDDERR